MDCDRKFRNFWGSTKAVRQLSDTICIENGLSIVENPKPHGKSYDQWLGDQAKPSHRELLRAAIDNALAQKPADLDELLKLLRESGCEVSKRGKSYRLKLPGWSKVSRLESLGEGYTLEDLLAVLAGHKEHTPRQKSVKQADPPKVSLLVDIQAKLQAGKGAGYVRWAKVFNLKQMAQTVNYLTEHNLLEYAVLEEKAAAATARHNELSAKIKAAEKRMAEIAVLRTHIINYAKTRDTYVAYRKAGYSKKFREEHEEEILLHQAAKNAFDDMGVKKLPKVKELQAEYSLSLENLTKEAEEQKNIQAKIFSRKQEIQQLRTYQRGLYEGLIQNHLSKDEYFTFKEKYEAKIETISKEIEQLKAGLAIIAKQLEQYKMLSQDAQHIKEDRQLTAALIDRLIDCVEVSREKRITVRFRFQSEFEHCEEVLSQCRNM